MSKIIVALVVLAAALFVADAWRAPHRVAAIAAPAGPAAAPIVAAPAEPHRVAARPRPHQQRAHRRPHRVPAAKPSCDWPCAVARFLSSQK